MAEWLSAAGAEGANGKIERIENQRSDNNNQQRHRLTQTGGAD